MPTGQSKTFYKHGKYGFEQQKWDAPQLRESIGENECAKVGRENKKDVYNTGRRYFTSFKQYKAQASQRPAKQAYITLSSALSQRIHGGKG